MDESMLSNERVLIVSCDVVGGQALTEAVKVVKGRVVGPDANAAEAKPLLSPTPPDEMVIDYCSAGPAVIVLLTLLLSAWFQRLPPGRWLGCCGVRGGSA